MSILISLNIILSLLFSPSNDQGKNIDFRKKNFPDRQKEFRIAVQNLEKGTYFFDKNKFNDALNFLLKANEFNPDNAELNYKIAVCYLNTNEKHLAIAFFQKTGTLDENIRTKFPWFDYYSGLAYQYNSEWEKAIGEYQKWLTTSGNSSISSEELQARVNKKIEECKNGQNLKKDSATFIPVKNINTEFDDYGSAFLNDSLMLFTSRRNFKGEEVDLKDNEFFEGVYTVTKENMEWTNPKITKFKDFDSHIAVAGVSSDGNTLLLYNDNDLLSSELKNGNWSIPKYLSLNLGRRATSALICSKCKTLFVVAEIPGGLGGKDIYISRQNEKGKWEPLTNLGVVNTRYDEEGLFVTGDTLYFASKGHNSMGGYDIFKTYLYNMQWTKPENLGIPINSPSNDLYFTKDSKGNIFFSSDRSGAKGYDIFTLAIPEGKKDEIAVKTDSVPAIDTTKKDTLPVAENKIQKNTGDSVMVKSNIQTQEQKNEVSKKEEETNSKNIDNISKEIKSEIAYCVVQVGAFTKITTKRQFKKEYNFDEYPIYIEQEGDVYKFLIKKKFYSPGGENLFDKNNKVLHDAARVQLRCKKKYGITDAFIAVYDKNDKRIAIIMDVPNMRYRIF
ncbi:MAG: hypothetical protein HY958_10595 [Bacteroidia bacterium]|nr:hypothetical protein [Bacteroidia bacterium]